VPASLHVADRLYFKLAMASRDFAVGEYIISRATAKPVLVVALPLLDGAGSVQSMVIAALDLYGDPLHIHTQGRAARALLDGAREQVAGAIGAQPDEIVFTSGGTESIALAIWGGVRAVRELGTRIVLGAGASVAIYKACDLASKLTQSGHEVRAVLTPRAAKLVSAQLFEAVTGQPASVHEFGVERRGARWRACPSVRAGKRPVPQ
jgi:kynureninase